MKPESKAPCPRNPNQVLATSTWDLELLTGMGLVWNTESLEQKSRATSESWVSAPSLETGDWWRDKKLSICAPPPGLASFLLQPNWRPNMRDKNCHFLFPLSLLSFPVCIFCPPDRNKRNTILKMFLLHLSESFTLDFLMIFCSRSMFWILTMDHGSGAVFVRVS